MKRYVRPMMDAQMFVANEYISVCYYIDCVYAPGVGPGKGWNGAALYHSDTGCGNHLNQSIKIESGNLVDGATISIEEHNVVIQGNKVGDRTCYFIPSDGLQQKGSETISGVTANQELYWVTNVGLQGYTIWMPHKGKIVYEDSNRPNHS